MGDGAQGGFGGGEGKKGRTRPQGRRRAGEQDRALPALGEAPRGFPPDDEAAEGVLSPKALEEFGRRVLSRSRDIAPNIVGDQREVAVAVRFVEEGGDIGFARGVCDFDRDRAARGGNLLGDDSQPLRRAARDHDAEPFARETPRQRGAEARLGANANHERAPPIRHRRFCHGASILFGRARLMRAQREE